MKLKQELQKNQPSFKQAFRFLFAVLKPIPLHQKQTPALYSLFRPIKFPVELRQQFWHQNYIAFFEFYHFIFSKQQVIIIYKQMIKICTG